jgi:predicted permease
MQSLAGGLALDWNLVVVAIAAALATGAICGIVPATVTSRADLSAMFRQGGSAVATSWTAGGSQSALLLVEVAAALVLLAATGIVLESLARMRALDRGFDATNVLVLETPLVGTPFDQSTPLNAFVRNVTRRLDDLGGVVAAAATFALPTDEAAMAPLVINDRALFAAGAHHGTVRWEIVTPEYFDVLRIALREGRLFDDRDSEGAPAVALVNRALALRYWAGEDPIRRRVTLGGAEWPEPDVTRHIVGVVADLRGSEARAAEPTIYIPLFQAGDSLLARQEALVSLRWIVRAAADPRLIGSAIATTLERAAPGAAVVEVRPMSEILAEQVARARFALQLLGAFAGLSVLLAMVGLYGFVTNSVAQRKKELGIRSALGASGTQLLRLVMQQGAQIILAGIVVGSVAAVVLGAGIEHLLFGTRALPASYLASIALLQLCAAGAAAVVAALPALDADPRRIID